MGEFIPVGPAIPHFAIDQWRTIWQKCRHVLAGEEVVKMMATTYLPKMARMTDSEYDAYKTRALFFGASQRTVQGLMGSLLRKPPHLHAKDDATILKVEALCKNITQTGMNLHAFTRDLVSEIFSVGRVGILVDMPPPGSKLLNSQPYVRTYAAEDIINWRQHFEGGVPVLDQVVLYEVINMPMVGGFGLEQVIQYRELTLNEDGTYVQRLWTIDPPLTEKDPPTPRIIEEIMPLKLGKPMTRLPFFFVGASHTKPDIERPPLLDLFNVNLSHYRSSADLEHGRHYTALPTPVVSGVDNDEDGSPPSLEIGSSTAWLLPNGAQAKMLEFNGQGLKHLENALVEKAQLMTHLGARMLETSAARGETVEALRLRQSADFATLNTITDTVGEALTQAVRVIAWWSDVTTSVDDDSLFVELNKEFFEFRLTPAMLTSLVQAWQSGAMAFRDLYDNLVRGETIDPERTYDEVFQEVSDEVKLRMAAVLAMGAQGPGTAGGSTPRVGQGGGSGGNGGGRATGPDLDGFGGG